MKRNMIFVVVFVFSLLLLFLGTRFFILQNFYTIEASQHSKTINDLVQSVETKIHFLENIASDYGDWDSSYTFMQGKNDDYIEENFREGSNTLETLGVDFMYFVTLTGETKFGISQKDKLFDQSFETMLLRDQSENEELSSMIQSDGRIVLYHRHLIQNSDGTVAHNGYLYVGLVLMEEYLIKNNQNIAYIAIAVDEPAIKSTSLGSEGRYDFRLLTQTTDETLISNVALYDHLNRYVLSIIASSERNVVMQGRETTYVFFSLVVVMLSAIFILFYYRQKHLEDENIRFEALVDKRTAQLNVTMKDLHVAIEQLERIAYEDELTKIATRRSFFSKVTPLLEHAHINNIEVTFAMVDLDDFKLINDNHGHDVGDCVLKDFCRICEQVLDEMTLFARLGGEEFVLCFENRSMKEVIGLCNKLQDAVHHNPVKINENLMISYTLSIGIANNELTSNIDLILKEADEKLYQAKDSGKNIIRSRGTETQSSPLDKKEG